MVNDLNNNMQDDDDFVFDPSGMTEEAKRRAIEGTTKTDLPPGFYRVIVESTRMFQGSEKNPDKALVVTMKVLDGDYAESKFDEWLSPTSSNESRARMATEQCARISNAIWGTVKMFRGSEIVDKVLGLQRTVSTGKDGKEYKNNFFMPLEEYEKKKNTPIKPASSKPAASSASSAAKPAQSSAPAGVSTSSQSVTDSDVPF